MKQHFKKFAKHEILTKLFRNSRNFAKINSLISAKFSRNTNSKISKNYETVKFSQPPYAPHTQLVARLVVAPGTPNLVTRNKRLGCDVGKIPGSSRMLRRTKRIFFWAKYSQKNWTFLGQAYRGVNN